MGGGGDGGGQRGGGRGRRHPQGSPGVFQQQEGQEEQASVQDVHETVQVHLWSQQGTRGGCNDCPVLTSLKLLANNQVTKEMCFYMEKKHQANPPTPVDPDVKIVTNKEFTVYVHRFGGYAMKDAV